MFQNITQSYTMQDASIEISIMLLGALTLGIVLGWLIKPSSQPAEVQVKVKKNQKMQHQKDDLQIIEGIGPKIEKLFSEYNVLSYADIVREDVSGLEEILSKGGKKFSTHNPSTWPDQARLAMKGKWSELEEYQEILSANKKKK